MNTEITFDERNKSQAIAFAGSADQVLEHPAGRRTR